MNLDALLAEIAAMRGRHDEFSVARRRALQQRLWQWQWEQAFRAMNEPQPLVPLIEPPEEDA
jgi:hypothetical protein